MHSPQPVAAPRERKPYLRSLRDLTPSREGGFWVLFAMATPRLFGTIFTIVLRRFLGPGVSGTFDLSYTPYKFLDNFRNFGTGPALVFQTSVSRATANTAWTLNMLFAVVITIAAQVLAHPIALYYRHPQIEDIFRVLSIAYIFASIGSVHFFLLSRDLDFRARSIPALGQVIAAGDIAVLFAVWGFGVGTLIARELTSVIAGAILLWAVYPFRPQIQLVPALAWKLLRYGVWVGSGLSILFITQNIDVFIGGHIIHNTSEMGFYTTSWNLAFIPATVCATLASTMVFPTLSRVQHSLAEMQEKLLVSIRQVGLIMLPAAAVLAALAPVLIVPLLGEKWAAYRSSFAVLSLLAIYAGNRTIISIFFEGYKSVGKPWIVPLYHTVKLTIMVPAMIYGAKHGIEGLALTYLPLQIIEIPIAVMLAHRVLQVSPRRVWSSVRTPLLATMLMGAVVLTAELVLLRVVHAGDLLTLLVCLPASVLIYLAALLLIDRSILVEGRSVLLRGF